MVGTTAELTRTSVAVRALLHFRVLYAFVSTEIPIASRAESTSLLLANVGSDTALHSLIYVEHSGVRLRITVVASESGRCRFHSAIANQFVIESRPDNDEKIVCLLTRIAEAGFTFSHRQSLTSPARRHGRREENNNPIRSDYSL